MVPDIRQNLETGLAISPRQHCPRDISTSNLPSSTSRPLLATPLPLSSHPDHVQLVSPLARKSEARVSGWPTSHLQHIIKTGLVMTSLPAQSTGPDSSVPTAFIAATRILPIMSAPRQQPAPSLGYQDGQQQDFLHRRKPPEQQEQITTEQQRFDQRQQQQQLEHQQQLLQQHIQHQQQLHHQQQLLFLQQQQQLASMGCKEAHYFGSSATGSTGQGRGGYSSAYIGPRPINPGLPFDSSGGSGNSSCAEGKATAENSAGGSGQSRLTRKSTAEDWFNTFNRDVRGNQSYPNYDSMWDFYFWLHLIWALRCCMHGG